MLYDVFMLKRLELSGFKSFSKKTILDFSSGISVIVGPNGSGKSNIIDAIRWLLGERDAKNVRGAKSEDLIFSGTDKKARVGMAQASLYLDNSRKKIPVDFDEVGIVRKLYRDGVAEYFINKSKMRLKDVVGFFAQAGLGTKGMAVTNQGSSDAFVKSNPSERREMLEEILGLRQYRLKKHEAELKLSSAGQNLEKAETAVSEILPHLRLLRRQSKKWEKRTAFANELAELENNYFFYKIKQLKSSQKQFSPRLEKIDKEINRKQEELKSINEEIKKIESNKPIENNSNDRRFALQRELGGLEAQLRFIPSERNSHISNKDLIALTKKIQRQIKQILGNVGTISSSKISSLLNEINEQIDNIFSGDDKSNDSDKKEQIQSRINSLQKELAGIEREEKERQSRLDSFNQTFRRVFTSAGDKREELNRLNNEKSRLLLQRDRWQYQWQDLEESARRNGRRLSEFDNYFGKNLLSDWELMKNEQRMARLKSELAVIGEIDEELIKEAKSTEERYQFLSSQTEDLKKAVADLNSVIEELDRRIKNDFSSYLKSINQELGSYFRLLFAGGRAKLVVDEGEINIDVVVPAKGIRGLSSLSGGEKSLLSIAVLFSLISVNPPPFLVFDEIDAALDESNSRRFVKLLNKFKNKTQFIIVTHNRMVMESADVLYGVAMDNNGVSKILSLKLD